MVRTPNARPNFASFYGVAASQGRAWGIIMAGSTAWAVGTYVDPKTDSNNTLILSGTNGVWTVDAGPEPGSGSNILGGVTAIDGHPWAAGIYDDGGSELPLVEHRQTYSWVRASSIWRMRPCAPFASAIA